jgi:UDPglucose 6-dehydrogenase
MPLLRAVQAVNGAQRLRPVRILRQLLPDGAAAPPVVAVLGLSYEPHSDDVRAAPSVDLVPELQEAASEVRVWDPLLTPSVTDALFPAATKCKTIPEAVAGAGVAVVLTEFPELQEMDWETVAGLMVDPAVVIDGKNCLNVAAVTKAGLHYCGVGRPSTLPAAK